LAPNFTRFTLSDGVSQVKALLQETVYNKMSQ